MWNNIAGALAIVTMVYLCANASQLVAAVCDRIRYGVQAADSSPDLVPDAEAPATAGKPTAVTKSGPTNAAAA